MKKTLLLISFLLVASFAFSQESSAVNETNGCGTLVAMNVEPTFMMREPLLDSRDLTGFQQSMTTVNEYSKDQEIAIAGWSLFSVGTAFTGVGVGLWFRAVNDKTDDFGEIISDAYAGVPAGIAMMSVGSAALVSGIVCLGVSYHNMGGHANLTDSGIRERKPLVTFNLQSSHDGLGFAIRF